MKFKLTEKHKKAIKSYFHAVAASAIVMGVALLSEIEPHYAVLIGAIAGPAIKWADKHDKDFGRGSQE
jgi:hypothetical protein